MLDTVLTNGIDNSGILAASASLAGLVVGLGTIALGRTLQVAMVVRGCSVLLLAIIATAELTIFEALPASENITLYRFAILAAGMASLPLLLPRGSLTSGVLTPIGRWRLPLGLVAVSLVLYTLFLAKLDPGALTMLPEEAISSRDLVVEPTVIAYSDQNTRIPVYVNISPESPDATAEMDYLKKTKLERHVIQTAPPNASSNCHGWVFTGGRYHVKCEDVDQILRDNGYEVVLEPRAGDLIVYRGVAGDVIHTGVVRSVGENGIIFVESKWGILGRYLHQATDQCFGQNYSYQRSSRTGHLLTGFAN